MKVISAVFCVLIAINLCAAETGKYYPKAFFTIDENGHQSPLFLINPESPVLARFRRSPQFVSSGSSSSSSSSSTGAGGQTFFTQTSHVQASPGGLESRFGEPTGHFTVTSGHIDPSGQVHYNTQHGRL